MTRIIFDFGQEEVDALYIEQANKALEVLNKVVEASTEMKYNESTLTFIFAPLANFALRQAMCVLNLDDKQLAKEVGNTRLITSILKNIAEADEVEETVVLVDTEPFNILIEYTKEKVSERLAKLQKSSNQQGDE